MTFSKISVLVPTRRRLGRLGKMIDSFEQTANESAELVFRIDDDDPETYDFLRARSYRMVVGPRGNGYASMASFFNELAGAAEGDVLMIGNDDMVFRTVGWPTRVLAEANKYPDGIFDFAVRSFNEDHFPFAIVSRRAVTALGFLWDPRLFWGDIFLRDIMGTFGRAIKLPEVEVEHEWAGHAPDATFLEGKQHEIWQRDPSYWMRTHAPAVAEAVEKLRGLIA